MKLNDLEQAMVEGAHMARQRNGRLNISGALAHFLMQKTLCLFV